MSLSMEMGFSEQREHAPSAARPTFMYLHTFTPGSWLLDRSVRRRPPSTSTGADEG